MLNSIGNIPLSTLKQYSLQEEIANSVSHGLGVLFGIVGLTVLLVLSVLYGTSTHLVSYLVYGISLILLYTSSTLYHALPSLKAKKIFKVCDHASIYLLIAGSYTPFLALNLRGKFGWSMMIVIWTLALLGIGFKLFFTGRFKFLSVGLYLGMGWIAVFTLKPLTASISPTALTWLIAGGLIYTVGTTFYLLKKIRFSHTIWHLFVLLGSGCHYISILCATTLVIR